MFNLFTEETRRSAFMNEVSNGAGMHTVNRKTLYDDVLRLYEHESITMEYPMYMKFEGEMAVDCGGVSRDVISGFWEEAYEKLFDGSTLLTPLMDPHINTAAVLPLVGRVLSHGFVCTGFLPTRVTFPTLAGMLLGPDVKIKSSHLVEAFVDYVSDVDREVLKEAITIAKADTCHSFPNSMKEKLLTVLSAFGCRQIPTTDSLPHNLAQIAKFVFQSKPMLAVTEIHSGIPQAHRPFWQSKSPDDLHQLYQALAVTPAKVLALFDEPVFMNKAQEVVYGYLRQFVGNMTLDQVRVFLRFVSGSSVCTAENLKVEFNSMSGFARRPIAHTCSNTLELPATYISYPEFEKEFRLILTNDTFTWIMDAL